MTTASDNDSNDLLLVGSVPLASAEQVFTSFGAPLARHLRFLPDGEVGLRRHWISRIHYQVLALHPDIEVRRRPRMDNGVERLNPRDHKDSWLFKMKAGAERIRFGEPGWRLGFARDAVSSYFAFRTLREKGLLPAHLRFQVSIPLPNSAVPPRIVEDLGSLEKIRDGYEAALRDELAKIAELIPPSDLAIQWDCATEVQDAYGAAPPLPADNGVARNTGQVARLSPLVPAEAALGFHFCFGTLGGWPRFSPADLGRTVELANAFVAASGRRVDWIHIPILDQSSDAFLAPLAKLEPQGARVFLGAIHNMARFGERIAAARKYCPEFGIAAYCGFGRMLPEDMPRVLEEHLTAIKAMTHA